MIELHLHGTFVRVIESVIKRHNKYRNYETRCGLNAAYLAGRMGAIGFVKTKSSFLVWHSQTFSILSTFSTFWEHYMMYKHLDKGKHIVTKFSSP